MTEQIEPSEYKYDVAFSLQEQDLAIATTLSDTLRSRGLSTFLYTEHQTVVAGTDGEVTFKRVFEHESRLVVVLYRSTWGTSPFTRFECDAVRGRGYEHGYDFVKFIPLDSPPTVPVWLPKTQIWIGMQRFGLEGAAAVIEARAQELGSEPREETVSERAARYAREQAFAKKREDFLSSEAGMDVSRTEFRQLEAELRQQCAAIAASVPLEVKISPRHEIGVIGANVSLRVCWSRGEYLNSNDPVRIVIETYAGHAPLYGYSLSGDPQRLSHGEVFFELTPQGVSWRGRVDKKHDQAARSFGIAALAQESLKLLIERAEAESKKKPKKRAHDFDGLFPSRSRSRRLF